MSRETRLNLIVLAILLAVLMPGGVILSRKKLRPTIRPMFMPHAVQREVAYMSPLETPPGKKRIEPPHTAKWIESLVRDRIGGDRRLVRPTDVDGLPLMSDKRTFQVLATDASAEAFHVWIIRWQPSERRSQAWLLEPAEAGERGRVAQSETVPVPQIVREELGETGVTRPPQTIDWLRVDFPPIKRGTATRLTHAWPGSHDFVN